MLKSLIITFGPILLLVVLARIGERLAPAASRDTEGLREMQTVALFLTGLVAVFLIVPAGHTGVAAFTQAGSWGVLHWVDTPVWLAFVIGFLAMDLGEWFSHYLLHRLPFLWRLHRIHHSDLHMDIVTGYRFHPIETTLRYLMGVAVIIVIGVDWPAVVAFSVLTIIFNAWEHANIAMPAALRPLQVLLITPELHRVHHSDRADHHNRNFGVLFTLWDRMFGTYLVPEAGAKLHYGLGQDATEQERDTLSGLFFSPFQHRKK